MLKRVLGVLVLGACLMLPGVAAAQERAPHAGSTAVGIDAGVFVPKENEFDNALIVNALLEYYLTPRFSLRTVFTYYNVKDTKTDLAPNIEGGIPAPDGYLVLQYAPSGGKW